MNTFSKIPIQNYINRILFLLFIVVLVFGCEKSKLESAEIIEDRIQIFYLHDDLNPASSIEKCGEIFVHNELMDTLILDKRWIDEFQFKLKKANKLEKSSRFDFRIYARLIVNKNQDTTHVCFGRNQYFQVYEAGNFEGRELVVFIREMLYNRSWLFE